MKRRTALFRVISLLLCTVLLIGVLPLMSFASDPLITITIDGLKKPIANEAPSFDVSTTSSGFHIYGSYWIDKSGNFICTSNKETESLLLEAMEESGTQKLGAFADGDKYTLVTILYYTGSNNYPNCEVGVSAQDEKGNVIEDYDGQYMTVSDILNSGDSLPVQLAKARGILTVRTPWFIASPTDHEHNDDVCEYDETGHWSSCSVCGTIIGDVNNHWYGSSYSTWQKESATATSEGRYYAKCSVCDCVLQEYTIPKTGEQTVVTTYQELVDAVAKGGKQYILCKFSNQWDNTYQYSDMGNSTILLDDPNADIFIDMNGCRVSYQTFSVQQMVNVRDGKLTIFNQKSSMLGLNSYMLRLSASNVSEGIYVGQDGELELVNMSIACSAQTWHEVPDVVSYGKLTINGGYFYSSRLGNLGTGFGTRSGGLAAVMVFDGEATINSAAINGRTNALYVGATKGGETPTVTINNARISAMTTAVYQGVNANIVINECTIGDNTDLNQQLHTALYKADYSGSLIINDGAFTGHENAIRIQDMDGKVQINGGEFLLSSENDGSLTFDSSAVFAALLIRSADADNIRISDAVFYGSTCIAAKWGKVTPSKLINPASKIVVDGVSYTDTTTPVDSLGTKTVVISDFPIKGKVTYTSAIAYNTQASVALTGDAAKIDAAYRHYQWQYYEDNQWHNISGATVAAYTFTSPSLIGKQVRVVVTADGFSGRIASAPITLGKEPRTYAAIEKPALALLSNTSIRITNYSSGQEYVITDTKTTASSLTDADWAAAVSKAEITGLTTGKTYYVYTRYKETNTSTAGNIITSAAIYTEQKVYCQNVLLGDYANYATIYIEKGETVTLPVSYSPVNANAGQNYSFSASSTGLTLSGVGVSDKVSVGTTGTLSLTGTQVGSYTLGAKYMTNIENEYGHWNVTVFDPEDVQMYQMQTTTVAEDVTMVVGSSYIPEAPEYYPCPADTDKYKTVFYMEQGTAYGVSRFYENDYISINPDTGRITAKAVTETPVTVCIGLTDGTSFSTKARFKLTVAEGANVPLEDFALSDTEVTLNAGEVFALSLELTPTNAKCPETDYASTNEAVAKVSDAGIISAVSEGTATIVVSIGSIIRTCKVTVLAADPCKGYTDINRSSWYHTAADFVIENGYMGSTKTDALTFEPNTKVSRAMVASILYRLAGAPAVEYKGTFTDVPAGKWFTDAIEWCAQNGVASGKGNGKFDPNGKVTRQELAVFMGKLLEYQAATEGKLAEYEAYFSTAKADLSGYPDVSKVASWAKKYVEWAVYAGIISGKASGGQTYLAPTDNATRAEFASILMRMFK